MGINSNTNNLNFFHRYSLRLKKYSYSIPGAYFIAICTYRKENIFGYMIDGKIILNVLGKITVREWSKTFQIRKYIQLDEYVIMPNHFHGIIILRDCKDTMNRTFAYESFGKPISGSISTIVRMFKSAVTRKIKQLDYPLFYSIWQRNYYEHIIRNENELNCIREYIQENQLRWQYDKENQEGKPDDREKNFWKKFT